MCWLRHVDVIRHDCAVDNFNRRSEVGETASNVVWAKVHALVEPAHVEHVRQREVVL